MSMSKLEGLQNAEKIARVTAARIAAKQWRAETVKEVVYFLAKSEKPRKADVEAFVRAEYDAAGAGASGRFQD